MVFNAVNGASSRGLESKDGAYTVGVLMQANYGARDQLRIARVPVGEEISDLTPARGDQKDGQVSTIVVVATDAPLLQRQLKRLASRVSLWHRVRRGKRRELVWGSIRRVFCRKCRGEQDDWNRTIAYASE